MSPPFETMPEGAPQGAPQPREETHAAAPARLSGLGLNDLEGQVDALIEECERLREENLALKQRQVSLTRECARLVERSEAVRSRVETMIARLRAMEES